MSRISGENVERLDGDWGAGWVEESELQFQWVAASESILAELADEVWLAHGLRSCVEFGPTESRIATQDANGEVSLTVMASGTWTIKFADGDERQGLIADSRRDLGIQFVTACATLTAPPAKQLKPSWRGVRIVTSATVVALLLLALKIYSIGWDVDAPHETNIGRTIAISARASLIDLPQILTGMLFAMPVESSLLVACVAITLWQLAFPSVRFVHDYVGWPEFVLLGTILAFGGLALLAAPWEWKPVIVGGAAIEVWSVRQMFGLDDEVRRRRRLAREANARLLKSAVDQSTALAGAVDLEATSIQDLAEMVERHGHDVQTALGAARDDALTDKDNVESYVLMRIASKTLRVELRDHRKGRNRFSRRRAAAHRRRVSRDVWIQSRRGRVGMFLPQFTGLVLAVSILLLPTPWFPPACLDKKDGYLLGGNPIAFLDAPSDGNRNGDLIYLTETDVQHLVSGRCAPPQTR